MADDYEDHEPDALPRTSKGGRGKGKGRGSVGGKTDGPGREILISKALSRLLRHSAVEAGLTLDGEGYARVDQVVSNAHELLRLSYWGGSRNRCDLCYHVLRTPWEV